MFWISKTFELPKCDIITFESRLQAFGNSSKFNYSSNIHKDSYHLTKPEIPSLNNMFSIHLYREGFLSDNNISVKLYPNIWLLVLMLILLSLSVICVFDERWRQPAGLSFPLLFIVPYIYHLNAHKLLSNLKSSLIPGYNLTSVGRQEFFRGFANPLKSILTLQQNAYIFFVIVFILILILWMFGFTDRFFIIQ